MKYFLILITIMLLFNKNARSQVDCPDLTDFTKYNNIKLEIYQYMWLDASSVDFFYKLTGPNSYDIKIDWGSLVIPTDNVYRFTLKNYKELYIQYVINFILGGCHEYSTKTINLYDEVECLKGLACYIKVDQTNSVYCYNQDWVGGEPDWFNYQGTKYYPIRSKTSCGTACCTASYILECDGEVTPPIGTRWEILNITYTSTGCDNSTTLDCLTNQLLPCESDCK